MYQIPSFKNRKGLFHAISVVDDGNMKLIIGGKKVKPEEVISNRKRFFEKIGVDINNAMTIWLQHGDKVIEANEEWLGNTILDKIEPPKADAVITDQKNIFLALTIADCVPVIIYDPITPAVGLVHAGWKGVDKKIVVKTIEKMDDSYGSKLENIAVGLGPCIGKESYIKDNFPEDKKEIWGEYVEDMENGLCSIDLKGYIKQQLFKNGVKKNKIYESEIDVFCDDRFYSYYRDVQSEGGDVGRMFCVVGLIE